MFCLEKTLSLSSLTPTALEGFQHLIKRPLKEIRTCSIAQQKLGQNKTFFFEGEIQRH